MHGSDSKSALETDSKSNALMVMLEAEGSFLLLRKGSGALGMSVGKWALPDGQILPKETDISAARRLLFMNTNINLPENNFIAVGEFEDDVSHIHLSYAKLGGSGTIKGTLESVKAFISRPLCHNEFCDAAFVPRELLRSDPNQEKMMERMKNSLSMLKRDTEKPHAPEPYPLTELTARAVSGYLPYPADIQKFESRSRMRAQQERSKTSS